MCTHTCVLFLSRTQLDVNSAFFARASRKGTDRTKTSSSIDTASVSGEKLPSGKRKKEAELVHPGKSTAASAADATRNPLHPKPHPQPRPQSQKRPQTTATPKSPTTTTAAAAAAAESVSTKSFNPNPTQKRRQRLQNGSEPKLSTLQAQAGPGSRSGSSSGAAPSNFPPSAKYLATQNGMVHSGSESSFSSDCEETTLLNTGASLKINEVLCT